MCERLTSAWTWGSILSHVIAASTNLAGGLKWTLGSPVNLLISGSGKEQKCGSIFQVLELAQWLLLHWVPLRDVFVIDGS